MTWKRTVLLFFACLLVLLVGTYLVLRETGVAESFIRRTLGDVIAGPFEVDRANVDLGRGTVNITSLQIAHPTRSRPLLTARDISVSMNTNPLGRVGEVNKVVLRGLEIEDLWLTGEQALSFGDVLKLDHEVGADRSGNYPAIVVEDAKVSLRFAKTTEPLRFDDVDLELLPVRAGSSEMVIQGKMTTLRGTRVTVAGSTDLQTGELRVQATATGFALAADVAEPFSPTIAAEVAGADLSGVAERALLWIAYPGHDAGELEGGFEVDLAQLGFSARAFPYRIRDAAGRVHGRLADDGTVAIQLDVADESGSAKIAGTLRRVFTGSPTGELALTATALRVDEQLLRALQTQPFGARLCDALAPESTGTIDAHAMLHIDGRSIRTDLDLDVHAIACTYRGFEEPGGRLGFPYPLRDVSGRCRVRDRHVHLLGVTGRAEGGGTFVVDGHLGFEAGSELRIKADEVRFCAELQAALEALSPVYARHYRDYAPQGTTDVELRLSARPAEPAVGTIRLSPRGASAAFSRFPYRIDGIVGEVEIGNDGVRFDLDGERGGQPVAVHGRFARGGGTDAESPMRMELWLRGQRLLIDDELRAACRELLPDLDRVWKALAPSGAVGCEVAVWRSLAAADPSFDVRLDLLGGRARPSMLPLELVDLRGPVFVHGTGSESRTDIQAVAARLDNAGAAAPTEVLLDGTVTTGAAGRSIDLSAVARHLPLDDRLADVLETTGALSRASWAVMAPSGMVDVIATYRQATADAEPERTFHLQLRDVGSDAAILSAPARGFTGAAVIRDGISTFAELRGLIGTAPVVIRDGRIEHVGSETRVRGTLAAEAFPVDDRLARLLGDSPLRATYLQRQARGTARINGLELEFTVPDDGEGFRLAFAGEVVAQDLALTLAARLQHARALVRLSGSVDPQRGIVEGRLDDVAFTVLGHQVRSFQARFAADPERIRFDDVSFRLHGGRVEGAPGDAPHLLYETRGAGNLAARLTCQRLRLSELLAAADSGSAPTITGNLSGRLDLQSLPSDRVLDAVGSGAFTIANGQLGAVPLFQSIYAVIGEAPEFEGASADFVIGGRKIEVHDLVVAAQDFEVKGQGGITMEGYLDLTLELPNRFAAADWLLVPKLLHGVVAQFISFKLHGYLRAPQVDSVLLQSSPARRPLEPIPAMLPERNRKRF